MDSIDFSGAFIAMAILGGIIGLALWGAWELIDWLFIFDGIKSTEPIQLTLELIIENGKVDTLYVYQKP